MSPSWDRGLGQLVKIHHAVRRGSGLVAEVARPKGVTEAGHQGQAQEDFSQSPFDAFAIVMNCYLEKTSPSDNDPQDSPGNIHN